MACGPGKGLDKLKGKLDGVKGSLGELQGDVAGGIESLGDKLNSAAADIQGSIKEMMPKIELPELPDLPDLKLPKLELPELPVIDKLQDKIGGVINIANDPLALLKAGGPKGLQKELDDIKAKFGDKIPDFDKLQADALSGKISLDDLCKKVPNLEIDQAEPDKVVKKGTPATAPETDAEKVPEPEPIPVSPKFVETAPTAASVDVTADGKNREAIKEEQKVDKEIQETRSETLPLTESEQQERNKRCLAFSYKLATKALAGGGLDSVSYKATREYFKTKKLNQQVFDLSWPELWVQVFAAAGEDPYEYRKTKIPTDELRKRQKDLLEKKNKLTWDFQTDAQIWDKYYNKAKELMPDYYGKADDFETAANEAIARVKSKFRSA